MTSSDYLSLTYTHMLSLHVSSRFSLQTSMCISAQLFQVWQLNLRAFGCCGAAF